MSESGLESVYLVKKKVQEHSRVSSTIALSTHLLLRYVECQQAVMVWQQYDMHLINDASHKCQEC